MYNLFQFYKYFFDLNDINTFMKDKPSEQKSSTFKKIQIIKKKSDEFLKKLKEEEKENDTIDIVQPYTAFDDNTPLGKNNENFIKYVLGEDATLDQYKKTISLVRAGLINNQCPPVGYPDLTYKHRTPDGYIQCTLPPNYKATQKYGNIDTVPDEIKSFLPHMKGGKRRRKIRGGAGTIPIYMDPNDPKRIEKINIDTVEDYKYSIYNPLMIGLFNKYISSLKQCNEAATYFNNNNDKLINIYPPKYIPSTNADILNAADEIFNDIIKKPRPDQNTNWYYFQNISNNNQTISTMANANAGIFPNQFNNNEFITWNGGVNDNMINFNPNANNNTNWAFISKGNAEDPFTFDEITKIDISLVSQNGGGAADGKHAMAIFEYTNTNNTYRRVGSIYGIAHTAANANYIGSIGDKMNIYTSNGNDTAGYATKLILMEKNNYTYCAIANDKGTIVVPVYLIDILNNNIYYNNVIPAILYPDIFNVISKERNKDITISGVYDMFKTFFINSNNRNSVKYGGLITKNPNNSDLNDIVDNILNKYSTKEINTYDTEIKEVDGKYKDYAYIILSSEHPVILFDKVKWTTKHPGEDMPYKFEVTDPIFNATVQPEHIFVTKNLDKSNIYDLAITYELPAIANQYSIKSVKTSVISNQPNNEEKFMAPLHYFLQVTNMFENKFITDQSIKNITGLSLQSCHMLHPNIIREKIAEIAVFLSKYSSCFQVIKSEAPKYVKKKDIECPKDSPDPYATKVHITKDGRAICVRPNTNKFVCDVNFHPEKVDGYGICVPNASMSLDSDLAPNPAVLNAIINVSDKDYKLDKIYSALNTLSSIDMNVDNIVAMRELLKLKTKTQFMEAIEADPYFKERKSAVEKLLEEPADAAYVNFALSELYRKKVGKPRPDQMLEFFNNKINPKVFSRRIKKRGGTKSKIKPKSKTKVKAKTKVKVKSKSKTKSNTNPMNKEIEPKKIPFFSTTNP